jgi:hypothetical protein
LPLPRHATAKPTRKHTASKDIRNAFAGILRSPVHTTPAMIEEIDFGRSCLVDSYLKICFAVEGI